MTFYNILDFILILIISFLIYHSYIQKSYLKIFEYFKIFFILTISAKLAGFTGTLLQKFYITKTDTYTTLILIAFVVNILILYYGWNILLKIFTSLVNSEKIRSFFAKLFTILEVTILTTFLLYITMQFYPAKKHIYPTIKKSFLYPKIEHFYSHFLNADFMIMVLNQDTATNHKELLFKSFKNSF